MRPLAANVGFVVADIGVPWEAMPRLRQAALTDPDLSPQLIEPLLAFPAAAFAFESEGCFGVSIPLGSHADLVQSGGHMIAQAGADA